MNRLLNQKTNRYLFLVVTILSFSCTELRAQQNVGRVTMKQLSPGNGWVLMNQRVYWTQDDGTSWADITPKGSQAQQVREVRFVDRLHGWAIVYDPEGGSSLRIVSTTDGGHTWRAFEFFKTSYFSFESGVGGASLSFVSLRQGWVLFQKVSSSSFSFGALFTTSDGGKTWSSMPPPPGAGILEFPTPQDGWLAGGVDGMHLWATHDGGQTWAETSVPLPTNCTQCQVTYEVPVFRNPHEGILQVLLDTPTGQKAAAYVTRDGGGNWQLLAGC